MKGLLFISHQTERFTYLQSIEAVLEGGCRQIQLRMKEATYGEVLQTAVAAKALCERYGAALYIDDWADVCKKVTATGVHLGKNDMSPTQARAMLGNDFVIGGTANTLEDIEQLAAQRVDYIGLGPFRFTTTKKNLSPILGLEGYTRIVNKCKERNITLPILAIGGITKEDIPDIMQTGVSGIALSSTILQAADPIEETKRIVELINTYKV